MMRVLVVPPFLARRQGMTLLTVQKALHCLGPVQMPCLTALVLMNAVLMNDSVAGQD